MHMNGRMRVCLVLAVLLGAVTPAARVTASPAAPLDLFTVDNTNSSGVGSLRQAILNANAQFGPDTIRITPALSGQVNLTDTLPAITEAVTITVPNAHLFQVFKIDGGNTFRGLTISSGVPVTVIGLTVQHMVANGTLTGAGIDSDGPLTLNNVTIISNTAGGLGGGVSSTGAITVTGGRFEGNTAGPGGGAIHAGGALVVNGSLIRHNQCTTTNDCLGGGLYAEAALTLTNTQIISNTSAFYGGGAMAAGASRVSGGKFEDNLAIEGGGGLLGIFGLTLTGTLFISNTAHSFGGGANVDVTSAAASVTNARFEANHAGAQGGGLDTLGAEPVTLNQVDFVANTAAGSGGGIQVENVFLTGGRFERNSASSGGGLSAFGTAVLTSTVFISNTAAQAGGASANTLVAQGGRFQGNAGGGLDASGGLVITDTQFVGNTGKGGAAGGGQVRITGALFANNSAPTSAGGLYAGGDTRVSNTQFVNNRGLFAGGLYATGGLTLTNSLFVGNHAQFETTATGGGLKHDDGPGLLVNTLFGSNTATGGGAAIALTGGGTTTLKHVTIASAALVTTSAVLADKAIVLFMNNIIANHAVGVDVESGFVTLSFNLFDANGADTTGSVAADTNHFNGNPRFANQAAGDFHLRVGSPAIDTGANAGINSDFDGDPRPSMGGFDLGYDEAVFLRVMLPIVVR
jgi:predicted outer membrane repeat protein